MTILACIGADGTQSDDQRPRATRQLALDATAAMVAVIVLAACGSVPRPGPTGVLQGHLITERASFPQPEIMASAMTTGPSYVPTAMSVEVRSGRHGRVVADENVAPGHEYRFVPSPGTYELLTPGHTCSRSIRVRTDTTVTTDVVCVMAG